MQPNLPNKNGGDNKNLMIAIFLCGAVLLGSEYFLPKKEAPVVETVDAIKQVATPEEAAGLVGAPKQENNLSSFASMAKERLEEMGKSKETMEEEFQRLRPRTLKNDVMEATVVMVGGRLPIVKLTNFVTEMGGSNPVEVFNSTGEKIQYFDAGWLGTGFFGPNANTEWEVKYATDTEIEISTQNGTGQIFVRKYTLTPGSYAIDVHDKVVNASGNPITVSHYAQVHKSGVDKSESTFYNFVGPITVTDDIKTEASYGDLEDDGASKVEGRVGWTGITGQYFMTAIVPDQQTVNKYTMKHNKVGDRDFYSSIMQSREKTLNGLAAEEISYKLYVGPKAIETLKPVGGKLEWAVDYGWFDLFAKGLHWMLAKFYSYVGNWGIAVILGTIVLKIALFPLATKSYVSMGRMRKMQPEMEEMKKRYGDDRERMASEMMALYKKHKVNPASGCWPMLVQIPIFFAFYKVILVSFDFRQAEFMLWITDLSVKDPFYVLPILMGASMFIQFRLNPAPADPVQAQVMKAMPIVFTFLFLMFPSGLVLYWLTNNVLSIGQQWYIMNKVAHEDDK